MKKWYFLPSRKSPPEVNKSASPLSNTNSLNPVMKEMMDMGMGDDPDSD